MIILGIDPGTAITGYGLIEEKNNQLSLLDYGCITTSKKLSPEERLKEIHQQLNDLINKTKPSEIAVEQLFFSKNVKTAMAVGQARGVILLTCQECDSKIFEYTPNQVKNAICGHGGADKKQVQKMVQLVLKLKEVPKPDDAADALAIAICHANSRKFKNIASS